MIFAFRGLSRSTRRTARTHRELKQLRKENAIAATRAAADRDEASTADTAAKGLTYVLPKPATP